MFRLNFNKNMLILKFKSIFRAQRIKIARSIFAKSISEEVITHSKIFVCVNKSRKKTTLTPFVWRIKFILTELEMVLRQFLIMNETFCLNYEFETPLFRFSLIFSHFLGSFMFKKEMWTIKNWIMSSPLRT